MRKPIIFTILISSVLIFSGCLGDFIYFSCSYVDDEGHCYQNAAVQDSEPEKCEEVTSDFTNSNPPKDKCYLIIAENTGDPTICDEIVGGPASYTQEECLANVFRTGSPDNCVDAEDETACRTAYAVNNRGCGEGFTYNDTAIQCVPENTEEDDSDEGEGGLSDADKTDINTIVDAATGHYMDFLEEDIELETDPGKKAGLQAYQDFLQDAGSTLESAQTTYETLENIKKIFLDNYDDADSIENMKVNNMLDPGLYDKIKSRLFGDDVLTEAQQEEANAENALTIYEAMLEQQSENNFMKQDKLDRFTSAVTEKIKGELTDELKGKAEELAEAAAGPAYAAVAPVGEALQAFQDEAKKQTFIGLARAYERRRADIEKSFPELSPEEVHKRTVEEVIADPYRDNTNTGFIKHGNLLENDCGSYNGELCIDPYVWWTAMDKTYRYNHQ